MKYSAGLVVVDRELYDDEPCVLCLRAYSNWDFPKGEIEVGEKRWSTAIRELEEETGYKLNDISMGSLSRLRSRKPKILRTQQISLPWISCTYGSGKSKKTASYNFVERVNYDKEPDLPVNQELGKPEHDEWRWVKVSELRELLPERLHNVVQFLEAVIIGQ